MAMVPNFVLVFQTQKKNEQLFYVFDIISKILSTQVTRNHNKILVLMLKMNISETVFFPSTVIEWNKLANNI